MLENTKLIAHRGIFDNNKIPENSISSFKEAINNNIPFELDVQLTKDNILVVFHDYDLKRMCNKKIKIQNTTYDEIKDYKLLKTNDSIPKLIDILKLNNDKVLIDIEIKNTKRIKETIKVLMKELKGYKNFIIKSFNPKIVRYIKKRYPKIKVGYLIQEKYDKLILNLILKRILTIKYCNPDFIAISKKLYKKKKYKELSKKIPTMIWTITNNKEINYNDNITYICNNIKEL